MDQKALEDAINGVLSEIYDFNVVMWSAHIATTLDQAQRQKLAKALEISAGAMDLNKTNAGRTGSHGGADMMRAIAAAVQRGDAPEPAPTTTWKPVVIHRDRS